MNFYLSREEFVKLTRVINRQIDANGAVTYDAMAEILYEMHLLPSADWRKELNSGGII